MNFTPNDIAVGKYVEYMDDSEKVRIGRVVNIRGKLITLLLAPFGMRGVNKGPRKRIERCKITGIVYHKKVRRFEKQDKSRKFVERGRIYETGRKATE